MKEGDVITIDGFTGNVSWGNCRSRSRCSRRPAPGEAQAREEKIWKAFEALMAHADEVRRMRVRANADTPDQAKNARERGAEGIGLCRTEHMFLGEERVGAVRQMIFADTGRRGAKGPTTRWLPLQREDFVGTSERWTACP